MAHTTEDGRFTINRAPAPGWYPDGEGTVTFMLVDRKRIVACERDIPNTHDDRLAATRRLKAMAGDLNE